MVEFRVPWVEVKHEHITVFIDFEGDINVKIRVTDDHEIMINNDEIAIEANEGIIEIDNEGMRMIKATMG